mgnify:CR=1 FL=1
MEQVIAVFEPLRSPLFASSSLSILVGGLSAFALIYLLRTHKLERNMRQILSMLAFFVLIIAGGMAIFGWTSGERIGAVKIYDDHLTTPYGEFASAEIENAMIFVDQHKSVLTPQYVTGASKRLILITGNGKTYSFSEKNYAVDQMVESIRNWLKGKGKELKSPE